MILRLIRIKIYTTIRKDHTKLRKFILVILCAAMLLSAYSCIVVNVDDTTEAGHGAVDTSGRETSAQPIGTGIDTIPEIPDTEPETQPPATQAPATQPPVTEPPATEPPATEPPVTEAPKTEFKADLSAYEKYLDPEDPTEYLILVNPDHPMTDHNYKPKDLTKVSFIKEGGSSRYMREYAAKSFDAMMIEAKANGCKGLIATSTYRSYDYQKDLFQYYVDRFIKKGYSEEEAIALTRADTAYPGESEHHTGLAVDVHNMRDCLPEFADTYEGKWLAENCWKFGFILRYPLGKEDITSYVFEPWHFRYVGRTHAKRIWDLGITLEEYLESYYTE